MAMKPTGGAAVMAQRAPASTADSSAGAALHRRLEFYPTPPWAARAGGELIQALDPGIWWCWEPACGEGHMAAALAPYFAKVHATDLHDHGWEGQHGPPLDFLDPAADAVDGADWIVTNPPFPLAAAFVAAGLRRARRGVAILARTALLESAGRFELMFGAGNRLFVLAPFIERVPMTLGGWDPKASTATSYAWFVWLTEPARRELRIPPAGDHPEIWPIPPGTRARLTRPDDARLWGRAKGGAGSGLFGEERR